MLVTGGDGSISMRVETNERGLALRCGPSGWSARGPPRKRGIARVDDPLHARRRRLPWRENGTDPSGREAPRRCGRGRSGERRDAPRTRRRGSAGRARSLVRRRWIAPSLLSPARRHGGARRSSSAIPTLAEYLARRSTGEGSRSRSVPSVLRRADQSHRSVRPLSRGAILDLASVTIVGELKRHFRDTTWAMRVPRGLQELGLQVSRVMAELSQNPGAIAHRRRDRPKRRLERGVGLEAMRSRTLFDGPRAPTRRT